MGADLLDPVDDAERLGEALDALSYPNRLELLAMLRVPRAVDEIHLKPARDREGSNPDRPLTRQAVRHHLAKLEEAGLVRRQLTRDENGRERQTFVADESRVYAVAEAIRRMAKHSSDVDLDPLATQELSPSDEGGWPSGARIVIAHGACEKRVIPLRQRDVEPPRGWIIGRSTGAQITLEYDPFVSGQNAEILAGDDGYELLDLRTARNGTWLNGERLPAGGRAKLNHGDIVDVGSSTLVFHEA